MKYLDVYRSETGRDGVADCNCIRDTTYTEEFLDWMVNKERENCVAHAVEMAKTARGCFRPDVADYMCLYADQIEQREPFSMEKHG